VGQAVRWERRNWGLLKTKAIGLKKSILGSDPLIQTNIPQYAIAKMLNYFQTKGAISPLSAPS
jgi:hypothetical protein